MAERYPFIASRISTAKYVSVFVKLCVLLSTCSLGHASVLRYNVSEPKSEAVQTDHFSRLNQFMSSHSLPFLSLRDKKVLGDQPAPQYDRVFNHQLPIEEWRYCYKNQCRCRGTEADCSQNYGKLTFVPQLPNGIKSLNFSLNSLSTITSNFFSNVTNVSSVDLSNNVLNDIHPDAFASLRYLTSLSVKGNTQLTYSKLHPVFSVSALRTLDISWIRLGKLPEGLFQRYPLPNLESLNLSGNRLYSGNLTPFAVLRSLVNLELGANNVHIVFTDRVLRLKTLRLELNGLSSFPDSCQTNSSLFPDLSALNLRVNSISAIPSRMCLPSLTFLDLSQNALNAIFTNSFSSLRFPKLVELHLDNMGTGIRNIADYAFNNSGIETLWLAHNRLQVDSVLRPDSFQGCLGLKRLVMNGNVFADTSDSQIQQVFGVLPLLQVLDLSSGQITNISSETFASLPSLEQLSLASNSMKTLPDGAFDLMRNLTVLDLSDNRFSVVSETAFNDTTRSRLQHLDLSGTLYHCSCQLMWFRHWFVSQPALFNHSRHSYRCSCVDCAGGLEGIPLDTFYKDKQACLINGDIAKVFLMSVPLGIVFAMTVYLVVAAVIKQFEKPLLVRAFGGQENRVRFRQNEEHVYDVFVAFAEEDWGWVRDHLMPELEDRLGLRLCIHQRDFHPGRNILDNIEDSVEKSHKVMMVFSTHFARSQWCQFELSLGQRHVMDDDDVMTVVCVQRVQPREWTSAMMAILRTSTYVQWSEEPRHWAAFWELVVTSLQDVFRAPRPQLRVQEV
ncbi:toll-like receptor 2 type-1 [Littorina saxatilis]|uniref:toll-like receptor 2 type-1 n=1 Tax=Littorina saxatilis TaxID=31220 RepID=UPI0038B4B307